MEYTKKDIRNLIRKIVFDVTKVHVESENTSLLDTRLKIHPADFLYIFDLLEKELHIPVVNIFIDQDYTIMRVDRMSEAILGLIEKS